jgi:hypothetical protein
MIDEVAFYGQALTPQQIAQTRQRGALGVIAPEDQADTLISIEQVTVSQGASQVYTAAALASATDNVQVGASWSERWPDLAQLIASLEHHGLRELIGELQDHGLKLFGHTSGKPALFSVDGVAIGDEGHNANGTVEPNVIGGAHDDDWIRGRANGDDASAPKGGESHRQEPAKVQENVKTPTVDWKDTYRGLGAPFVSSASKGGTRGGSQSNLAEFDRSASGKKTSR